MMIYHLFHIWDPTSSETSRADKNFPSARRPPELDPTTAMPRTSGSFGDWKASLNFFCCWAKFTIPRSLDIQVVVPTGAYGYGDGDGEGVYGQFIARSRTRCESGYYNNLWRIHSEKHMKTVPSHKGKRDSVSQPQDDDLQWLRYLHYYCIVIIYVTYVTLRYITLKFYIVLYFVIYI